MVETKFEKCLSPSRGSCMVSVILRAVSHKTIIDHP